MGETSQQWHMGSQATGTAGTALMQGDTTVPGTDRGPELRDGTTPSCTQHQRAQLHRHAPKASLSTAPQEPPRAIPAPTVLEHLSPRQRHGDTWNSLWGSQPWGQGHEQRAAALPTWHHAEARPGGAQVESSELRAGLQTALLMKPDGKQGTKARGQA